MLKCVCRRPSHILVLVLYALAMMLVGVIRHDGDQLADQSVSSVVRLPDGAVAAICGHEAGDPSGLPVDHDCCVACVLAAAPGLGGSVAPEVPAPPQGTAVLGVAGRIHQIASLSVQPTSRGPPEA